MWEKLLRIFKTKDLRNKILYVFGLLVIFRLVAAIPIPGIDKERLITFLQGNQFFGLLDMFSGGAMSNLSIVMLGVGPYITSSIIMQLLTMIFPSLKTLYFEEGEIGKRKFNRLSRFLTVPLGILQGYGILSLLRNKGVLGDLSMLNFWANILTITAGTVFLMWIGELISDAGIGNGVSIIIFAGIIAGLPSDIQQTLVGYTTENIPMYLGFILSSIFVVAGVVVLNEGIRNVSVSYAKRVRGSKVYGGVSSNLPLRVNQAGVIPIIFAISIILFPQMIANFLQLTKISWLISLSNAVNNFFQDQFWYAVVYFVLVFLFTYFYTAVTFDPKSISDNLQKQGAFVPGIRPGQPTADHLAKIMNRITLAGGLALGIVAVLPYIIQGLTGQQALTIGGTAILIVVSVALDIMKQIKAQMTMREYEGF